MSVRVPVSDSTTATFLFTDIEGSTQLLRSYRTDYARILAEHHEVLREQFLRHGGREIDNQGDAFFVAFTRARDATLCAAACQRELARHSWPGGATVRVRMGIHTGEAELDAERYVGLSVHRAARVSGVGHGGQILVSQTTASLLEDETDLPGIALRDLGEHRLKDLSHPARLYQADVDGMETTFPPLKVEAPPRHGRRKRHALIALAGLAAFGAAAAALTLRGGSAPLPVIVPNSVVRIDPTTLKQTLVVRVGPSPDLVVAAGGYIWLTHDVLRGGSGPSGLVNSGTRTLTRVDPATGDATAVGGGLAPCGIAPDPSGDVWVANCYPRRSGQQPNVVRIDAKTLAFKKTFPAPGVQGYYRGLTYGDGSLWAGGDRNAVTRFSATGAKSVTSTSEPPGALAWSEASGDLWMTNFDGATLTRLNPTTMTEKIIQQAAINPGSVAVDGDTVWVGDWSSPTLVRLHTIGRSAPRRISLPVANTGTGVWTIAAGAGYIWATTPGDQSLWRIDPSNDHATRIALPYPPAGVAADASDVWVTLQ